MKFLNRIFANLIGLFPLFHASAMSASSTAQSTVDKRVLKIRNAIYNSDEERANKLVEYLFEPGRAVKDFNQPRTPCTSEHTQLFRDWDSWKAFDNFGNFDSFDKFNSFDNFGKFNNGGF
jgi:hypothetical protein